MRRYITGLGLALALALALSVAGSGSATEPDMFTQPQNNYPVAITGIQEGPTNYFEGTPNQRVECQVATYEGRLEAASSTLTMHPHYEQCKATTILAGGGHQTFSATIHLNGCYFLFTVGATESEDDIHGSMHIVCPDGKSIQVRIAGGVCVVDIVPQTNIGGITYTNKQSEKAKYLTVHASASDITYIDTDILLCPFEGNFHGKNGKFVTSVNIDGYQHLGTHTVQPVSHGETTETGLPTNIEGKLLDIDIGTVG